MATAVTIWWGCWQWAHEANAPRVATFVEEQAPSVVESSRADYDELQALTQVVTTADDETDVASGEGDQSADERVDPHALQAAFAASAESDVPQRANDPQLNSGAEAALGADTALIDWPAEETLLTFARSVQRLVIPGLDATEPVEPVELPQPARPEPVFLGDFQFTYYWISNEYPAEESERTVQLYDKTCEPLHRATPEFADRLALEGTGRLLDGRTVNVDGECDCGGFSPCFFVTRKSQRWGVGVATRPLKPFRSVAVDTYYIPAGTRMYIPELDGKTMPGRAPYGGFVHDGCVIADDTGGGIDDTQIDIFFGLKGHYQGFDRRHRIKSVKAYRDHERCSEPSENRTEQTPRISV